MRRLLIILLFLIASVWAGVTVMHHPGYMVIVASPWMVEAPLWFVLLSVFLFLMVFYFIFHSIDCLGFLWFRLKNWPRARREHRYAALEVGLTQAESAWRNGQLERAVVILNQLRQRAPRHPRILMLLEKVYVQLADWQNLLKLLPMLRKAKVLNATQAEQLEKNIYCEMIQAAGYKNLDALQRVWESFPRRVRKHPDVVVAYVKRRMGLGDHKTVEGLISKTLKQHWQPELVEIYGSLPFVNPARQLVVVGAWLKLYGQKPALLLTLGQLCVRVQLWGKAKDYFEQCLALGPHAEASLAYGRLLEQLEDPEAALMKYREGLLRMVRSV